MTKLPTLLVTEVIRSSHQGDSHGGAYLVDLESQNITKVLDWNTMGIDWSGRGQGRGLRGIAFYNDDIYIAASDELFIFDQQFCVIRSYKNTYLKHCHEICIHGDMLYLTSTAFDSVLEFDLQKKRFTRGWLVRYQPGASSQSHSDPRHSSSLLRVGRYDPNRRDGPSMGDTTHVNNVVIHDGTLLVSGVHLQSIMSIGFKKGHRPFAAVPAWTHNAQPFRDGTLYNSTMEDAVCYGTTDGSVLQKFELPRYDPAQLTHADIPDDYARQAFGRGLVITGDDILIASSSPSTLTAWDFESGSQLASVNVGMDLRNAPHGLAVWPYGSFSP